MRGMTLAVLSAAVLSGCATKSFVTERVDDRAAEVEAQVDARIAALQRALDESETTIQRQAASYARSTRRPIMPLRWPCRRGL